MRLIFSSDIATDNKEKVVVVAQQKWLTVVGI